MNEEINDKVKVHELSNALPKVIVVAGPTASGKTAVSIELAKRLDSEIVSSDSVQVYKDFNIGSAKVTLEEMNGVRHYMLDEVECTELYSIYDFKKKADEYIEKILESGKVPVIAGGTGYYIQSLLKDIEFEIEYDEEIGHNEIRSELYRLAGENGNEFIHEMLKDIDEESYKIIHANNLKRVIRAIEFYKLNDQKISDFNRTERQKKFKYDVKFFVLYFKDRELLYERVNRRVDKMVGDGLFEEVDTIYKKLLELNYTIDDIAKLTSFKAIGYKEVLDSLQGKISKEEAIEKIKLNTRHLVKKQYTWFRHQIEDAVWIPVDEYGCDANSIVDYMISLI